MCNVIPNIQSNAADTTATYTRRQQLQPNFNSVARKTQPPWPHVNNTHQVWSWYDHTLQSYSVFGCRYVTWPCDLDLWPFDLEQLSFMAGHVANLATEYEDPTPIRSWVTSYNGYHWLSLKMRTRPLRMRGVTWPVSRGEKLLHFWNPRPRFAYLYTTSVALRWI